MEELDELWFDENMFDIGLDEYLTKLFEELDKEILSSNCNNFQLVE